MSFKRKIIVGVGDLLGCGYYRCAIPYKHLSRLGFDVHLTNKLDMVLNPQDVLVLQRQHHDNVLAVAKDFKDRGGTLVFELDDYFHELPPNNPARASYPVGGKELKNLEAFMELSDLMTVSTPSLKENYRRWAKNVHVCYNVLDLADVNPTERTPQLNGTVRLGWAGSATHLDDFLPIVKPVSNIMLEYPQTKFIFVGMDYRNIFPRELHSRIMHAGHTFPMRDGKALFYDEDTNINPVVKYYKLLQDSNIDIAIAPLLNVSFNRSKSEIKLLEYGICNIPFVASDYGPYAQYIREHRETQVGFLCQTNSEWKRALKKLIINEQLRTTISKNNYDTVVKHHTTNTGINQWIDALASIDVHPSNEPGNYTENIAKIH